MKLYSLWQLIDAKIDSEYLKYDDLPELWVLPVLCSILAELSLSVFHLLGLAVASEAIFFSFFFLLIVL